MPDETARAAAKLRASSEGPASSSAGGRRQPMACFRYYKTVLVPQQRRSQGSRKGWTHDEDVLLVRAVEQCGESNWQRVSELLGNTRSSNQCLQRWRYSLDPSLNKGKWSEARRWDGRRCGWATRDAPPPACG